MDFPIKELSHLIEIISNKGFKIEGIILDDLPDAKSQFCSKEGLIPLYTKKGIKRTIVNQIESHLRDSVKF